MPYDLAFGYAYINLSKDAAAVLDSAAQAVKAILERRAQLDAQGKADTPLVVLAGEEHNTVSYQIHHMLVLKGLLAHEKKIAVGIEMPHDFLAKVFAMTKGARNTPALAKTLYKSDPDGQIMLKTLLTHMSRYNAPFSFAAFVHFLLRNEVPTRLTDSACNAFGAADTKSARAIEARNRHMKHALSAFGKAQGARILFQTTGNSHVMGHKLKRVPAEGSLSDLFKKEGAAFLALLPYQWAFTDFYIPHQNLAPHEKHFHHDLPETKAAYMPGREADAANIEITSAEGEAAYVNGLLERAGEKSESLDLGWYQSRPYRQELEAKFDLIKNRML